METKKKKNHIFIVILSLLFIAFLSLYFTQVNGYYEYSQYNKKTITEEAIKKFELDVLEGKEIYMEEYLKDNYKDYSNNLSNLGLKTSKAIEDIMSGGIKRAFKVIAALFVD